MLGVNCSVAAQPNMIFASFTFSQEAPKRRSLRRRRPLLGQEEILVLSGQGPKEWKKVSCLVAHPTAMIPTIPEGTPMKARNSMMDTMKIFSEMTTIEPGTFLCGT